jgi:hypothetical protein
MVSQDLVSTVISLSSRGHRDPSIYRELLLVCCGAVANALFSLQEILQKFSDSPSHQIFGRMRH